MEDAELERRFGDEFVRYRRTVGAILPKMYSEARPKVSV